MFFRPTPNVSIIIPAMNEADNLRQLLPTLPEVHEVVLIDGNSTDGTVDVAREVMPDITVVKQTRRGKGNALACGFAAATGDILVMFDADGSADPAEIPRFVDALLAGADFAKGSRFVEGGGSHDITRIRDLGNRGLNLVGNLAYRTHFTDLCYGYNAFWRDLLPVLDLPPVDARAEEGTMLWGDGFEIESLIFCRMSAAGVVTTEVPSVERERTFGVSNLNAISDGTRVLRTLITERQRTLRRRPEVANVGMRWMRRVTALSREASQKAA
ncbi:glycosyltransferase family 2 protein [Propionicicella superfundia]|uniref:glycosyltransferase family 2 protein n=1 Tax=Propionicicella superfundia TaxID=348582 RepID=UPI000406ED11|nr:glycosyltransferase family 2 protein [Propionicicella superfundia]